MSLNLLGRYGLLLSVTTAFPLLSFALDLPNLPASPIIPSRTVALNAPDNGVTDATAAINKAMAALSNEGGGTLEFAAGTYLVKVNPRANDYILQLQSKVRLQGAADGKTIIKVANDQSPYNTILGTGWSVSDVDIENITFDLNGENNPITSAENKALGAKAAIRVDAGPRTKVANCTFINIDDVNTLIFSGTTATDVEVYNNNFTAGMPAGFYDFDHSTIYSHAVRMWIHYNTFTAKDGPGTPVARCAIETHGDDQTVGHNTINGYSIAMNITGQATSSNRQVYRYNLIENTLNGIEIWSQHFAGQGTYGMENITIEYNTINLDPFGWRRTGSVYPNQPSMGIFLTCNPIQPVPIDGLAITNNTITFPTGGTPEWGDTYSGGVILWTYNGLVIPISNLTVSSNIIKNALGPAIWTNVPLEHGSVITSNTIENPSRSSSADQHTGIYVSDITEDFQIQDNAVSDSAKVPMIASGIDAVSSCRSSCTVTGNAVTPKSVKAVVGGSGWVVSK